MRLPDAPDLADDVADPVHAAIATIEAARRTHILWRDYWLLVRDACGPDCADCKATALIAGDIAHQEQYIREYDNVLDVLRSIEAALPPAELARIAVGLGNRKSGQIEPIKSVEAPLPTTSAPVADDEDGDGRG